MPRFTSYYIDNALFSSTKLQLGSFPSQSVRSSDEASFQCVATNQLSSTYSAADLRVFKLAPTFRKQPLESETYAAEGKAY